MENCIVSYLAIKSAWPQRRHASLRMLGMRYKSTKVVQRIFCYSVNFTRSAARCAESNSSEAKARIVHAWLTIARVASALFELFFFVAGPALSLSISSACVTVITTQKAPLVASTRVRACVCVYGTCHFICVAFLGS
jgi:hypothetical protein